VPFPCQNGGMGVEMRVSVRISPFVLFPDRFRVKPYPSKQKKGVEGLPLKDLVRGPVCWAKMVHSGNPGNKLSGHHLSVWSPSICSQGMPCQVLLSGMLGLGRGGQRQLKFSKAMDSNFTVSPFEFAAVFQNMPLTTFTSYKLKTSHANRLPKPCTLCSLHRIKLFPAKIKRFPGPPPPDPLFIMLQKLCPTIVVGEASRGATF